LQDVSSRKENGEPVGVGEELGWHWQ